LLLLALSVAGSDHVQDGTGYVLMGIFSYSFLEKNLHWLFYMPSYYGLVDVAEINVLGQTKYMNHYTRNLAGLKH